MVMLFIMTCVFTGHSAFPEFVNNLIFMPNDAVKEMCSRCKTEPRQGRTQGGVPGCSLLPSRNLKNTDFVDTVTLNVLCDSPFSRNQPLKSVDD